MTVVPYLLFTLTTFRPEAEGKGADRLQQLIARPIPATFEGLDDAWTFAVSPDGRWMVTGSLNRQGDVRRWDLRKFGEERPGFNQRKAVRSVAVSCKGTFIAAGCEDGKIRVWDWRRRELIAELGDDADYVVALAFHPTQDGVLVSGHDDSTVRLWDISQGKQVALIKGHTDDVLAVGFNDDGRL